MSICEYSTATIYHLYLQTYMNRNEIVHVCSCEFSVCTYFTYTLRRLYTILSSLRCAALYACRSFWPETIIFDCGQKTRRNSAEWRRRTARSMIAIDATHSHTHTLYMYAFGLPKQIELLKYRDRSDVRFAHTVCCSNFH